MSDRKEKQWVSCGDIRLIHEIPMEIHINGSRAGEVSCTPQDLKELAVGWLLTEGRITDPGQIDALNVSEEARTINVKIDPAPTSTVTSEPTPAPTATSTPSPGGDLSWSPEEMWEVQTLFDEDPPLHRATKAAHSCMILRHGQEGMPLQVLYRSEDAGRHSALDKAIGWALIHRVDLRKCLLMTSGRISTRMAAKAGRVGAGALAGKGTVTAEAVEIAKSSDMILMGCVRADSLILFHPGSLEEYPAGPYVKGREK